MRRAIVALVVLVLVGAGMFGLGYLFGRPAAPRPRAAPSASPTTVLVPRVLHLALTGAVEQVLGAELAIGKVQTRTGGEPGTIVAQFPPPGTSARLGSQVNLFVSTGVYPRGAFAWCPNPIGTLPVEHADLRRAGAVALAFDRALLEGDRATLVRLADPSVATFTRDWAASSEVQGLQVEAGPSAVRGGGGLVTYGCGSRVASRTVAVGIHDATNTASAGHAIFYLVLRADGWKVWASY
jgi:hypothetical protein